MILENAPEGGSDIAEIAPVDFVPLRREITAEAKDDSVVSVTMHDGSVVRFRQVASDYDPKNRDAAYAYVREHQARGEVDDQRYWFAIKPYNSLEGLSE